MAIMKKRACATGSFAIIWSISRADGITGFSSRRLMSYSSSTPPPCSFTTRGLRTSARFGVRKPPAAPNARQKPFCSCRSLARAPSVPTTSVVNTMSSARASFNSGSQALDLSTSRIVPPAPTHAIAASTFSADALQIRSSF